MKQYAFMLCLLIGTNAFGQTTAKTAKSPNEFVPAGYVVFEELQGDLNKDKQTDYVVIVKGTNRDKVIKDEFRGQLDRNRRGIIVAFKNGNKYDLVMANLDCFSSENEDGGVYFAPELNVSIQKGNLFINYGHGRYGFWSYNFRYQNSGFELIGFDHSQDQGPVIERSVSINFMTQKMLTKENINQNAESGDEKFKETWKKLTLSQAIKLKDIVNFDELYAERLLDLAVKPELISK